MDTRARVVINGKFKAAPVTGVQRYAEEVTRRLIERDPVRYRLAEPRWSTMSRSAGGFRRRALRMLTNVWEQTTLARSAGRSALIYCPANVAPLHSRRVVLVVHDVFPLTHPEWYSRSFSAWTRFILPRLARNTKWIITDSQSSREQFLTLFPFAERKLSVVYPGIGDQFTEAQPDDTARVRKHYGLDQPYFLCIGSLDPRKNFNRIIEAWEDVRTRTRGHQLAIVGLSSELFRSRSATKRALGEKAGARWLGFVPDKHLVPLLSGAEALLCPSLDEGFGFPPLEAMACGTPALVSRAGALREVCGEAALSVDANDAASIGEGIVRLIEDRELPTRLRTAGLAHVKRFTWESAIDETEKILIQASES